MTRYPIKDQIAIVGVGTTGFSRSSGRSSLSLALEASTKAILDAGLHLTKIVDVDHPDVAERRARGETLPQGQELPRFMVLAFSKP